MAANVFGLDWAESARLFRQICSGQTWGACRKFTRSAMEYGHLLLATGDPCGRPFSTICHCARSQLGLGPTADFAVGVPDGHGRDGPDDDRHADADSVRADHRYAVAHRNRYAGPRYTDADRYRDPTETP
jgi:hypothetical protein